METRLAKWPATPGFARLLEAAPDAIVMVDAGGTIQTVNPRPSGCLDTGDEMVGRLIEMLVPERARSAHVAHRQHYHNVAHAGRSTDQRNANRPDAAD